MAKYLHPLWSVGWNYLSIPKLQRLHRWSLGMAKQFHPKLYWTYTYLSRLVLKLNYISKMDPSCDIRLHICKSVSLLRVPQRFKVQGNSWKWWHLINTKSTSQQMKTFMDLKVQTAQMVSMAFVVIFGNARWLWNWDDEERSSTEIFENFDSFRHLSL